MVTIDAGKRKVTAETILDALDDARICNVFEQELGRFRIEECCDNHFFAVLTREQLLALADELRALAGEPAWLPISTAPQEIEHEFLGWDGKTIDKCWCARLEDGAPVYVRADWVVWEPRAWMPLPAPPSAEVTGRGPGEDE